MWKDIHGYEGLYEISTLGEIRNAKSKRVRVFEISKNGYERVALSRDGKHKHELVHRLLALTFLPNPHNKREVNHIDGDKQHNILDNIEWSTSSENKQHSKLLGLRKTGESHYGAKLSDEQVKYIIDNHVPGSKTTGPLHFSKMFDVSKSLVQKILYNGHRCNE